ncbi:MAG: LamG domain-containing protein [Candidatus Kariarchaeaceae archaeon]
MSSAKIIPIPHDHIDGVSPNLSNGLVAQWGFDEESGSSIVDNSVYDSKGSLQGPERILGPIDKALEFDGVDDYVEILEDGSAPTHLSSVGEGSFSIWFNLDEIPLERGIAPLFYYGGFNPCPNTADAANQGFIIEIGHGRFGSHRIYFTTFADGCEYPSFCVDTRHRLFEDQWYHFTVVVEENYNTLYLNGKELVDRHYNFGSETSSEFLADAVARETIWLGKGYWNAQPQYFDGSLDEIRIYDRPLSKNEILDLYNLGDFEYRNYDTMFNMTKIGPAIVQTTSMTNTANHGFIPWIFSLTIILTSSKISRKKND